MPPPTGADWVAFDTFLELFEDAAFWEAVRNTLAITLFQLVFSFPLPIGLALLLHGVASPKLRGFVQSVVYLPHFFSWVLVITFFVQMLGGAGLLAAELRQQGFEPVDVMTNPDTFMVLVTAEAVWKDVGWGSIVFLAALSTMDPTLYEAAAADGATSYRRLLHVTLPGLRPVIVLLLILRLGDALSVGFEQYLLQREAVGSQAAEVLDTYVYHQAVLPQQWGIGAAAGLVRSFIMGIPRELFDAARIDGANEWTVLFRIVLPLSRAVIGVVGLFYAVGYWNAYFNSVLYIDDNDLWPSQRVLQSYILAGPAPQLSGVSLPGFNAHPPTLAVKMAVVVVTVLPALIVYPFVQKNFTKGMLVGAVKG